MHLPLIAGAVAAVTAAGRALAAGDGEFRAAVLIETVLDASGLRSVPRGGVERTCERGKPAPTST